MVFGDLALNFEAVYYIWSRTSRPTVKPTTRLISRSSDGSAKRESNSRTRPRRSTSKAEFREHNSPHRVSASSVGGGSRSRTTYSTRLPLIWVIRRRAFSSSTISSTLPIRFNTPKTWPPRVSWGSSGDRKVQSVVHLSHRDPPPRYVPSHRPDPQSSAARPLRARPGSLRRFLR